MKPAFPKNPPSVSINNFRPIPSAPPLSPQSPPPYNHTRLPLCKLCDAAIHPCDAVLPRPCLHGPIHASCMEAEERLCIAAANATGRAKESAHIRCHVCYSIVSSMAYDLMNEIPSIRLPFSSVMATEWKRPAFPHPQSQSRRDKHVDASAMRVDLHVVHHFPMSSSSSGKHCSGGSTGKGEAKKMYHGGAMRRPSYYKGKR